MPSNTQNFRVKHGLEVIEAASFSNTITIAGNTEITGKSLNITGGSVLAVNAEGKALFGNTVTVANGGLTVNNYTASNGAEVFRAVAANSTVTQSLIVNTSAVVVSGNLTVTGVTTFNSTDQLSVGTGDIVLYATAAGSPVGNASVTVNRGTSTDTKILWDEVNDRWMFTNDGSSYYPFRTYSSLVYQFSTNTTTAADPGQGFIRFNNATYSSVTEIAIDLQEIGGTDVTDLLSILDDSTSTDRAILTFRSSALQDKFVVFKLSSNLITATTGVIRVPVTYVAGGASTFSANEILFVEYSLVGQKGAQGAQGYQGNQGAQGFQGYQGAQGFQGYQGAQGFQGNQGNQGFQGNQGTAGTNGAQGFQGYQGAQGFQGNQGNQGDVGAQGFQGRQGNQGFQGQAITGAQGNQGFQGNQGAQGNQGNQGYQGNQGSTGVQGFQGNQGAQGYQGNQGNQGFQGYQGAQGFQGNQGNQGGFSTGSNAQVNSLGIGTAASGTTGEIRATDNITAYYSSDARFKENVADIQNALAIAAAIGGKTFDWSDDYIANKGGEDGYFIKKHDIGVIAQDVQSHCPQLVRIRDNGSLAVDYSRLVAVAFAAIKELKEEVDSLKK